MAKYLQKSIAKVAPKILISDDTNSSPLSLESSDLAPPSEEPQEQTLPFKRMCVKK